ncbi:MAG: hypothetical protein OEW00_14825 [candidate division Zixibacteria bacterium]|nr:hypothetical protein [candidate division Zixibacteria bacterium]
MKYRESQSHSVLLNILLPGLGHVYWKEYSFGLFIFLVMLIAAVLFVASLFVAVPATAKVFMFGLPGVFYAFTFVDLYRTVRRNRAKVVHTRWMTALVLVAAVAIQVLAPIAPVNFLIRNAPEFFLMEDNGLIPVHAKGDLLMASPLAYRYDFFFLGRPVLHALPERYDAVRFRDESGADHTALVLGLPGEEVELTESILMVNGLPCFDAAPAGFTSLGDWPLTSVEEFSILVATLRMGEVDRVRDVPLMNVRGKVSSLW